MSPTLLRSAILWFSSLAGTAAADWSYPGCPDVGDADFRAVTLLQRGQAPDPDLAEPVKLSLHRGTGGQVDIYFVERRGKVKRYLGATRTVETLGSLDTWKGPYTAVAGSVEEGLVGIALDPDFAANQLLYLAYNPAAADVFRVSRFRLSGKALEMGSEKVLVDIPTQREECCHTGGALAFDAYGDLWITVGNNAGRNGTPRHMDESVQRNSDEWGASSTASLRGAILRIHPDGSAKGYRIPPGNFGAHFAQKAQAAGHAARAAAYLDTARVRPELYIKGIRNPYSLALDPVRRWVGFGDVGPDNVPDKEEFNLFKQPAFAGWPYFAGNNAAHAGAKNAAFPVNASRWNQGLDTLPAASPAIYSYSIPGTAIAGPIYRYDGDLASSIKLPPHFHRKWFVTDYTRNFLKVLTLDEAGDKVLLAEDIFRNYRSADPLDFQAGPDGALYLLNYAGAFGSTAQTAIVRMEYTGSCHPATPKLEKPVPIGLARRPASRLGRAGGTGPLLLRWDADAFLRVPEGASGVEVSDTRGQLILRNHSLAGMGAVEVPARRDRNLLVLRWLFPAVDPAP